MCKIVYIVKTKLHYYPPCISQIRMIKDLGVDIEVLYGTSEDTVLKLFDSENIKYKKIGNISVADTKIGKLYNWYKFRKALKKEMKKYDLNNTIFWFGTAETAIPMKGLLKNKKYILTILELLDKRRTKLLLLKGIAKGAKAIAVCESTRAYLMKDWFELDNVPYVFPNKPYSQIRDRRHKPSCQITKEIIDKIKDENIILYQGMIQDTKEIIEIAKALNKTEKKYKLVLMGIDKFNSFPEVKKYYKNSIYYKYIPAPLHLEITSYARIGIAYYKEDSLNKIFCAPNKIYEYTGFGIPMLCNDVPGLKNTVGINKAAECIELNEENIIKAINKIDNNYEEYSKHALDFFEGENTLKTMEKLLKNTKVL